MKSNINGSSGLVAPYQIPLHFLFVADSDESCCWLYSSFCRWHVGKMIFVEQLLRTLEQVSLLNSWRDLDLHFELGYHWAASELEHSGCLSLCMLAMYIPGYQSDGLLT